MQRDRHKRSINHVVLVTSDAVDADIRQFRIKPPILKLIIVVLCIIIGAMMGYLLYEEKIWQGVSARSEEMYSTILVLQDEKAKLQEEQLGLETQIAELNDTVQLLSDNLNQKIKSENELAEQIAKQSMPTDFPLNGSASMEQDGSEETPICVFTAAIGTTVIATASGTVTIIVDDAEYGHSILIDHGNGYSTIYRNGGTPMVKQGDSVVRGTTLYIIEKKHEKLGYQMMKDEAYISPTEMLKISG